MAKKKRKPSKYNIFVGKMMKNEGMTMKQASAAWNKKKSGSKKKSSKRKITSRKKPTTRRITRRRKPQSKGLIPAVRNVRSKIRSKIQSRTRVKGPIWKVWLLDKISERIGA